MKVMTTMKVMAPAMTPAACLVPIPHASPHP
jgi:hypothetical protein